MDATPDLPDLASRALGGSVVAANDELFAQRENLIRPEAPHFDPSEFGHKGKIYDGWETRRRRDEGHDWAIVALGAAGVVDHVVVDTAWFRGNYPPHISVEAASVEGYPSGEELAATTWHPIVERSAAKGDTANVYPVSDGRRFTHVRLCIYPDGGVARLRVHGEPLPDPALLRSGPFDLAATENGGRVTSSSNAFYSAASNLIAPGPARTMGEGWETSRRRDGGHDWVEFQLACSGHVRLIELDTSHFVGNAPGSCSVEGKQRDSGEWVRVLGRSAVQPDIRHRFPVDDAGPLTHLRVNAFPDGGMARVRAYGIPTPEARAAIGRRFAAALPLAMARDIL